MNINMKINSISILFAGPENLKRIPYASFA